MGTKEPGSAAGSSAGWRSLLPVALAVLALLAAYTMGSSTASTVAAAPSSAAPAAGTDRTIVMTGTGESLGVPDQLSFRFAVHQKSGDVTDAMRQASGTMHRVLGALKGVGVAKADVQTTGLSVRPDYAYLANSPPVLTGYVVTQSATVLVRHLDRAGRALSAVAAAGGNAVRLGGLGLRIGDRDGLLRRARDAAVAEAQAKATQYAGATGQSLGPVVSLKEVHATRPPGYSYRSTVMGSLPSALRRVPIRAGSENLKVTVSVVWQLR